MIPPATAATDASGATKVTIFAKDNFGYESEVFTFDVVVNRPPSVGQEFLDVVLYRDGGTAAPEARDWTPSGGDQNVMYTLANYFDDLDLDILAVADGEAAPVVMTTGDTACTFSTSPSQPTGRIEDTDTPPAFDDDLATATSHATVNNGAADADALEMMDLTILRDGPDTDTAVVLVNAAVPAGALGPFTLMVTCSDLDARVSSSAKITVRN